MARPRRIRRLIWLLALVGGAYLIWRRRQQQIDALFAPAAQPPLGAPPPAAPPAERPAARGAESAGPRRIPTRVHRGAPPARPAAPDQPAPAEAADEADAAGISGDRLAAPTLDAAAPRMETLGPGADGVPESLAMADEASAATFTPGLAPSPGGPEPEVIGEGRDSVSEAREPAPPDPERRGGSAVGLLNINTADEDALVALPGIGRALARRIIAYRQQRGPFGSVEQLIDIQGIGERNIEEFRAFITV